jgi:N-acylneuraminate cytidylyltransferase
MNLAIIPARGGSKRIPRKNIRNFCGKPMIAWTIETAKRSGLFDHIVVSTDDDEIADVARQYGAEVPFMRPAGLSDDHTATRPVVNHAITEVARRDGMPEFTCCIYATAPFMQAQDLIAAHALLLAAKRDFVFSATTFPYPIQRALKHREGGGVEMIQPEHLTTRSQDLIETFHDAGQFYWGRTDSFLNNIPTLSANSEALMLPRWRVHDIDTMEDWDRAEIMCKALELFKQQSAATQ